MFSGCSRISGSRQKLAGTVSKEHPQAVVLSIRSSYFSNDLFIIYLKHVITEFKDRDVII